MNSIFYRTIPKTAFPIYSLFLVFLVLGVQSVHAVVFARPNIVAISPAHGNVGDTIVITGHGFNTATTNNIVVFGGVQANVVTADSTTLRVIVPLGALNAPISVTNSNGRLSGYSAQTFIPTFYNACLNDTTLSFSGVHSTTNSSMNGPVTVALVDMDNDGKLDLAIANKLNDNITLFRNVGTSGRDSFLFVGSLSSTSGLNHLKAVDIDGDGKPELVCVDQYTNRLSIFKNTSTPGNVSYNSTASIIASFSGTLPNYHGLRPLEVGAADLDGDGKPDLIIATNGSNPRAGVPSEVFGNVVVLRNKITTVGTINTGTFDAPFNIEFTSLSAVTTVPRINSVCTGDFDQDGKIDIAAMDTSGNVFFVHNTSVSGSLSFDPPVAIFTGINPQEIVAGDLDGDGKPEVVCVTNTTVGIGSLVVVHNIATTGSIATTSFEAPLVMPCGDFSGGIALGDLNGDGKMDITVTNVNDNSIAIFRNLSTVGSLSTASFASPVNITVGLSPTGVSIGDVDGDNKPDVVTAVFASNSISVIKNSPLVVLDTIMGNISLCPGVTGAFSDSTTGGTWSLTNTSLATINSSTGVVTPIAAGIDTVMYSFVCNGVPAVTSKSFIINPLPTIVASTMANICYGTSTSISATGGVSYVWSPSAGLTDTVSAAELAAPLTTTQYTVTGTSALGCKNTDTVTVGVGPAFTIDASPFVNICNGQNTTLTATGGATYSWSPSYALSDTFSTSVVANPTITTTYTLTGTVGICSLTDTVTVAVTNIPGVHATGQASICVGASATLTGTGATTYSWAPSYALTATTGVMVVSSPTVNTTYTVTGTTAGCNGTDTVTVVLNPYPNVTVTTLTQSVCGGSLNTPIHFTGTLPGTGFSWTISDTTLGLPGIDTGDVASYITHNITADSITATITVTPYIGGCLGLSQTSMITVRPLPTLNSSLTPASICSGTIFNYPASGLVPGSTISWSRAVLAGISDTANAGMGNPMETLFNTTADSLMVTYIDTISAWGCTNTQSVNVYVKATPQLSSSLTPPSVCDSATFLYIPTSATPGTIFTWGRAAVAGVSTPATNGTGLIDEMLVNTTALQIPVVYIDTLAASGCTNIQNITVLSNPLPVLASLLSPAAVCANTNFVYNSISATPFTTFGWSRAAVTGISNAAANGFGGINEMLVDTTLLPVNVTYADTLHANGCINIEYVTVQVKPVPVLTSTLTPAAICDSTTFHYVPSASLSGSSFSWGRAAIAGISTLASNGADSITEVLTNTTPLTIPVVYSDTLRNTGCANIQTITVNVYPRPMLSSTLTPASVCDSTQFLYVATSATPGSSFTWSRGTVAGISNIANSGADTIREYLNDTFATSVSVIYYDTIRANGCMNVEPITLVVKPTPMLSSTLTPNAICDSTAFSYVPGSATTSTTFTWSRAATIGISDTATSGSGGILEYLNDTTFLPVTVNYLYTLNAAGCPNAQTVTVVVNPTPVLTGTLSPSAICDSQAFAYTNNSLTTGTTFTWTRAAVPGISNPAGAGSGDINETLYNTTNHNDTVMYVDTLHANGCLNTQTITLVVKPLPILTSASRDTICSGTHFNYVAISSVPGTTTTWNRTSSGGITPATASGSTDTVSETLINTTHLNKTTLYHFILSANGCIEPQNVTVIVAPAVQVPVISTRAESPLCFNTLYQNFGALTPAPDSVQYAWTATNATIFATSAGHQNCLVDFNNGIGSSVITLTANVPGISCYAKVSDTIVVTGSTTNAPGTIYYVNSNVFFYADNTVDSYQWGYDDKVTLDSTILTGQIDQSYINLSPNTDTKYYWCITRKNGCMEKTYYNAPVGVINVNAELSAELKAFPNPTNDLVNVEITGVDPDGLTINLSDMTGRTLKTIPVNSHIAQFKIGDVASGIYFIECYKNGIKLGAIKLIKN